MKKSKLALSCLLLLLVLAAGLGCSPAPGTKSASSQGAGSEGAEQQIIQNETKLWEAFKAKDSGAVGMLLADDVQVVSENGRFNKTEFLTLVSQLPDMPGYSIRNPKVLWPSKDVAILTYKSEYTMNERAPKSYTTYQTTVWINRDNRWLVISNQETQLSPP